MAQWAYRTGSFVSAGNASGGDLVIDKPTGTADGDLIVYVIYFEPDTTTISITGGFTSAISLANTGAFKLEMFYRIASGEGASYTISNSDPGNQWRSAAGAAYQSGTGSGPWEDVEGASQADGVGETGQTAPSVTTTGVDRLLVYGNGNFSGTDPTSTTGAAPTMRGTLGGTSLADAAFASAGATGTSRPVGTGTQDYVGIHEAFISDSGGAAGAPFMRPSTRMLLGAGL